MPLRALGLPALRCDGRMKGLDVRTQCNLALASNIKSARLEWIGKARHASVIERPSEALAIMRNFLRG